MAAEGYSAKERQKILEDTSKKLVEIICTDSSQGEQFRKQVLNMTVENLDRILKSEEAKSGMKDAIVKSISIALQNPDYMNPLLFRSILTMGSVSTILQGAFAEAYKSIGNFGVKTGETNIVPAFIDNLVKVFENDVTQGGQRGGEAATTADLQAAATDAGVSAEDEKAVKDAAAASGVDVDKELKDSGASAEQVKEGADAAKAAGITPDVAKGAAQSATGVSSEDLKMAADAKNASDGKKGDDKGGDEKKSASQKAREGVAAAGAAVGKAADWMRNLGKDNAPLANADQMTTGVLLEDLLTGLDHRSTEMEKSMFESLRGAIVKHINSAEEEIVKTVSGSMQSVSNELSQKLPQTTYTLYVYSAFKQNMSVLTNAIQKWVEANKSPQFQFSTISSASTASTIIDNMINELQNANEMGQTGGAGQTGGSKITPRNPNIKKSKKHPLFRRKITRKYRK